jgi:hypothetical protein
MDASASHGARGSRADDRIPLGSAGQFHVSSILETKAEAFGCVCRPLSIENGIA